MSTQIRRESLEQQQHPTVFGIAAPDQTGSGKAKCGASSALHGTENCSRAFAVVSVVEVLPKWDPELRPQSTEGLPDQATL